MVAGGTGLVGSHLLPLLCAAPEFGRVLALSRRPLVYDHPKLANRIVRFDDAAQAWSGLRADVAFCCLGTTRAAAGSQEAFARVDRDLVIEFARAALQGGAQRFVLVSSVGAAAASKNFYLRVKGETEGELGKLGFASLDILQPSLLLGWRRELRPLELAAMAVMPLVNPLMLGNAERYRAVSAATIARALLGAERVGRKGIQRYTHRAILELAAAGQRDSRARTTAAPGRESAPQG
jgi:uncharacterized protein YbjT (DUF2867 family)